MPHINNNGPRYPWDEGIHGKDGFHIKSNRMKYRINSLNSDSEPEEEQEEENDVHDSFENKMVEEEDEKPN